jgi:hypothetical protein
LSVLLDRGSPEALRAIAWYGMSAGDCAMRSEQMSSASVVRMKRMNYVLSEDNSGLQITNDG